MSETERDGGCVRLYECVCVLQRDGKAEVEADKEERQILDCIQYSLLTAIYNHIFGC